MSQMTNGDKDPNCVADHGVRLDGFTIDPLKTWIVGICRE